MRVSAVLDEERAKKLKQLQSLTGQSTSDVLKRALDLFCAQHVRGGAVSSAEIAHAGDKLKALLSSDFIGCAAGPDDLADQYKDYL